MTRCLFICRTLYQCAIVAALCLALPAGASAASPAGPADATRDVSGWHARIAGSAASPQRLVAVDKKEQALFLFERHSPLRLMGKYVCSTGQNLGDKLVEGDLKTPEGIYFVVRRLASGLDFEKYGYEAYTLNYPNPVDRLRKKTGHGIWIHGRGAPITPNLTEGCVSLNNTDIAMLGKNLTPGTPVALAHGVRFVPVPSGEDKDIIGQLHKKTYDWAKAWSSRSKKFFDYYDQEAYAIAQGESFTAFRQQKERVFKTVSWIDTRLANLQALQGPGYWVTWFEQDYRASNLSTKGVRRLYWQRDRKGDLRIVGMEWAPHLSGTLTAGLGETYVPAEQPVKEVASLSVAATPPVARPAPPATQPETPVAEATPALPTPVAPPATAPVPAAPAAKPVAVALAHTAPEAGRRAAVKNAAPSIHTITAFVETWRLAWEKGDLNAYVACYATDAVQGSRAGSTAIRTHKSTLWRSSKPAQVVLTNVRITTTQDTVAVDMHQSYTDTKSFADMGIKTLHLRFQDNAWRIAKEDWKPMP